MWFQNWFIMTLDYKMRQILLENVTTILIITKIITTCVRFFIAECDSFIANCDSYYKMRQFY